MLRRKQCLGVLLRRAGRSWCSGSSTTGATPPQPPADTSSSLVQQQHGVFRDRFLTYEVRSGKIHETTVEKGLTEAGSTVAVFPSVARLPTWVVSRLDIATSHLLPHACQEGSVPREYFEYLPYHFMAAVAGSMAMVFSTQSMLYGVGLGAGAIPVAAALSWVLKDGIGQLGGVVFASVVNRNFDADPKRWRFVAGLVLDVASVLEALIPFVPCLFLPLASVSNALKNVSFLAASASRASIHAAFAQKANLADVTARSGSQTTVAATIGTALAAAISAYIGSDCTVILGCVLVTTATHLTCLYKCILSVPIQTLNLQRFELLASGYLRTRAAVSPHDMREFERFVGRGFRHTFVGYEGRVEVSPALHDVVADTGACLDELSAEMRAQAFSFRSVTPEARERRAKSGYFAATPPRVMVVLRECIDASGALRAAYAALQSTMEEGEVLEGASFEEWYELAGKAGWNLADSSIEDTHSRVTLA